MNKDCLCHGLIDHGNYRECPVKPNTSEDGKQKTTIFQVVTDLQNVVPILYHLGTIFVK